VADLAASNPSLSPIHDFLDVCHLPEAVYEMQQIQNITGLPKEIVALAAAYEELSEWVERDTSDELVSYFSSTAWIAENTPEDELVKKIEGFPKNIITIMKSYTLVTVLSGRQMDLIDMTTTAWFNMQFRNNTISPQSVAGLLLEPEEITEALVRSMKPRDIGTLRQMARVLMTNSVINVMSIGGDFGDERERRAKKEMQRCLEAACIGALLPFAVTEAAPQAGNSSSSASTALVPGVARPTPHFPNFDAVAPAYKDGLAQEFLAHPYPTKPKSSVTIEEVT
ncbi:MAG TPA: hypothetical protein VN457_03575, partial [Chlamydiales bacterium]|nr:hypothetical protein [Chlamydiales bacterium]